MGADPAFVREHGDFFEHFFEHDDIMSDDGFLFGEKFSKGKRSLDYDATKKEQGRTGKKAKATWSSRSIENALSSVTAHKRPKRHKVNVTDIIHLQPQNKVKQKHTPNECLKMKTAMVMKLRREFCLAEKL